MKFIFSILFVSSVSIVFGQQLYGSFNSSYQLTNSNDVQVGALINQTFYGTDIQLIHGFVFEEFVITAIDQVNEQIHVNYYPNPVQDWLNIETDMPMKAIRIYDLKSNDLLTLDIENLEKFELDLTNFSRQLFFIQITFTDDQIRQIKIIRK